MEPKKRNALFLVFISLAGLWYVWDQVYNPAQDELAVQQERLDALETSNRNAQLTYARGGGNIEEQLELYERHAVRLEQLIPSAEEVPALLQSVSLEAGRAGVELSSFAPDDDVPGAYYTKKSYAMTVVGEYHDVGRFLTSVASLPRVVTPVRLDVSQASSGGLGGKMQDPVQVSFNIETYVVPELNGGPAPAEVGEPGGDR